MQKTYDFNKLTVEEMREYIEKNAPNDKAWFKKEATGTRQIKDKERKCNKNYKSI